MDFIFLYYKILRKLRTLSLTIYILMKQVSMCYTVTREMIMQNQIHRHIHH
jgi:hypothetical protein